MFGELKPMRTCSAISGGKGWHSVVLRRHLASGSSVESWSSPLTIAGWLTVPAPERLIELVFGGELVKDYLGIATS